MKLKVKLQLLPSVGILFRNRRPFTVVGAVRSVDVFSVKRLPRWPFPHIRNKILERIKPAVTNPNSSTSVIRVFFSVTCVTSAAHFDPTPVCRRIGQTVGGHFGAGNSLARCVGTLRAASGTAGTDVRKNDATFQTTFAPAKTSFPRGFQYCPFVVLHGLTIHLGNFLARGMTCV